MKPLGLKQNWKQFSLLVLINTFVSGIVGLERTILSEIAESIGVFRLWRDSGYAVGALLAGILADIFDLGFAITITGIIVMISGLTLLFSMRKLKRPIAKTDG